MPIVKSDPATLNIVINALHNVAEEMGVNLLRSARSTIIREARDCSCALLDAHGRVIAEAEHVPVQMSSLSLPMKACLAKFDNNIRPGEVFVTNDPYIGGQHLQDITIFSPIFDGDQLLAFAGSIAHHIDIGGGSAGLTLDAQEFYEEGLRFTAMKFSVRRDFRRHGIFRDIVHSNFRAPETTWGDLCAQLAANEVGRRRVLELATRYDADVLRHYMEEAMDYSERRMRAAILEVPDGVYHATDQIDDSVNSDDPLEIKLALTVARDSMELDFSGTHEQVKEFLNVPLGSTYSSAYSAVMMALTAGREPIPANDGCYRPLRITAPTGSLVNPTPPAAVRARMCGAYRVFDCVLLALQRAMPEQLPALGFHANTTAGLSRFSDGRYSIFIEDIGGGWGGTPLADGADMLDAPLSNCRITPVESVELDHPFIVLKRYELLPDTGGAGRHRGGLGSIREYEVVGDEAEFFGYSDRHRFAPKGVAGGADGTLGGFYLVRSDNVQRLRSKTRVALRRGDRVQVVAGGGGGWGSSSERAPVDIAADVDDGRMSEARALEIYPHLSLASAREHET